MRKILDALYDLLKRGLVKGVLRLLGKTTGILGWIVSEFLIAILDHLAKPLFDLCARKWDVLNEQKKAEEKVEKLEEAKTPTDYLNALNDK